MNLERLKKATHEYDGDAVRPDSGITPETVARTVLEEHWDVARCFCPTCVLARAYLEQLLNSQVVRDLVDQQAADDGLWAIHPFGQQPIMEAYLQQELRRLHALIEKSL